MDLKKFIFAWVLPSAKIAYKLTATSAEVFCRHSFGQRYAPSLVGSFLFCFAFTGLMRVATPQQTSSLLGMYLLTFFLMVAFHLGNMWWSRTPPAHSHSAGQSWPMWQRFGISQDVVQLLVEPGLHFVIGLLLFSADNLLSVWLQLAGLCLFVKGIIGNWKRRNRIFDALDARAEGERMNAAIRQRTAPQSGGEHTTVPVMPAQAMQPPPGALTRIVRNLDPALQRLMTTPEPRTPPQPPANPQLTRAGRIIVRPGQKRSHAEPLNALPRVTSKPPKRPL